MALTHSSYSKENYERLEFLGDSILDFVVGEYFFLNTESDEGKLTKMRAQFVSTTYLAKVFDRLQIENQVILGKSFKGSLTISIKADIVEAIIASVYLDSSFERVKKFILSFLNLGNYKTMKNADYKSQLQEKMQADKKKVTYKTLSKLGQSHNPIFEIGVYVNGEFIAKGKAASKHEAQAIAAQKALKILK